MTGALPICVLVASTFVNPFCFENNVDPDQLAFVRSQLIRIHIVFLSCKHLLRIGFLIRPNKKIPVFRVTRPYLNLLMKTRFLYPANFVCGGYTVFTFVCACVCASVRNVFFP